MRCKTLPNCVDIKNLFASRKIAFLSIYNWTCMVHFFFIFKIQLLLAFNAVMYDTSK